MVLSETQTGVSVRIIGFEQNGSLAGKLRQLGLMPGDSLKVLRKAPFDGPFLVDVRGREIALGVGIASLIQVEEYSCASH